MAVGRTDSNPQLLFGRNLRRFRLSSGISQEELAFRADLDRTYISSVERGHRNISIQNIFRLAAALGRDPRELLAPASGPHARDSRTRTKSKR
jgi:transcriptional regulator with XRE-family HTH domain